jgi:hypothetical protein
MITIISFAYVDRNIPEIRTDHRPGQVWIYHRLFLTSLSLSR